MASKFKIKSRIIIGYDGTKINFPSFLPVFGNPSFQVRKSVFTGTLGQTLLGNVDPDKLYRSRIGPSDYKKNGWSSTHFRYDKLGISGNGIEITRLISIDSGNHCSFSDLFNNLIPKRTGSYWKIKCSAFT